MTVFKREISRSVNRTFLYIKFHFPRKILKKLLTATVSTIPDGKRVVNRGYRLFPLVAFNLFSPTAKAISKNTAILMENTIEKPEKPLNLYSPGICKRKKRGYLYSMKRVFLLKSCY